MVKYLVEIGTEELPYKFIPSAMEQLQESLSKELENNRITFKDIQTYGTPRRLTVIIEDISESQPDLIKKIKGPPAKAAFDEKGNVTQAAIGFAKKQGIDPKDFYKESVGNIEYVFADVKEHGRNTSEVLKQLIPDVVLKLQGSHFMRWADLEIKFSRPIRWIVSLMGNEEVKLRIGNVESTRFSRGHRFYNNTEVEIKSIDSYFDTLYNAKVIVDQNKRLEIIEKLVNETAQKNNGRAYINKGLLEEVTYIIEWPIPVIGSFDKKYLVIPKSVIVTVMASHQRYFPVFAKDNDDLLNHFITISNQGEASLDNIRRGNERVLKARLDDAIFFYTEDTKRTLESRIEELKGVTFQKGLGTVYDKVNRIREISYFISEELDLDKQTVQDIERTALLSKADLVTALVREFTELQGVIGSDYAKLDGENDLVSIGIKEHYLPISSESGLATSITGQIVGISDKIDTISGVFGLGKAPTGSADPLGLRRAALGILLTIINKKLSINLSSVIENAVSFQPVKIADKAILINEIREFIIQRLRIYLNENYKYDVVEAAIAARDPLANLNDLIERVAIISNLVKKSDYNLFHESANRIIRILKTETYNQEPKPELFAEDIESKLWNCSKSIDINNIKYNELVEKLVACIPVIVEFFDKVLVMDPDPQIKENRLALLGSLKEKFVKLADFSKIVA